MGPSLNIFLIFLKPLIFFISIYVLGFDESYSATQFSDSAYFKNFLYGLILNGLISLSLFLYVKTISSLGIHSFRYILLSIVYVLRSTS